MGNSTTSMMEVAKLAGVAIKPKHLANNAGHAVGLALESFVNRLRRGIEAVAQQVNRVLDRLHRIVNLMGDGSRQFSGSREFLHFEHAPLHL